MSANRWCLAGLLLSVFGLVTPVQASEGVGIEPYGFFRASLVGATHAMSSAGNQNLAAPMTAWPEAGANPSQARDSFQLNQTRLGLKATATKDLRGQLEIDFVTFAQASGTTALTPRLRVANINYHLTENDELNVGQDWDIFSPSKPLTFNPVALYFQGGNAGFIRPQLRLAHHWSQTTIEGGIGLLGRNTSSADNDVELNLLPSFAARLAYSLDPDSVVGVSGVVGRLRFSNANAPVYQALYGVDAYYEGKLSELLELHVAGFYGQNLGSGYLLTLALASGAESNAEVGGYATLRLHFSPSLRATLGAGIDLLTDDNGSPMAGVNDNRILSNLRGSVAVSYLPVKPLELFIEDTQFATRFLRLVSAEKYTVGSNLIEAGAIYTF